MESIPRAGLNGLAAASAALVLLALMMVCAPARAAVDSGAEGAAQPQTQARPAVVTRLVRQRLLRQRRARIRLARRIKAPAPAPAATSAPVPAAPRPLTFGIYPGGAAGTFGPSGEVKPEVPSLRLAALRELRGTQPFVLHLYDSFTRASDAAALPQRLERDIADYTAQGFQVELVLTYRPAAAGGDVPGFVEFVRNRVAQLGPNRGVTSLQVTNEVNIRVAPNAADGWYGGAVDALLEGAVAAKSAVRAGGYEHLKIGFNWAYELGAYETELWTTLGKRGGPAFADAVDWVGLDAYPGTWGPPLGPDLDLARATRAATLNALDVLRNRYMPLAGLGAKALRVAESGYPTGTGRSEAMQLIVMRAAVQAVSDVRSTYGVTDYRWFDLRDADSSGGFEQQYGITRDDYSPKAGFAALRDLVATLTPAPLATTPVARAAAKPVSDRALTPRARRAAMARRIRWRRAVMLRKARLRHAAPGKPAARTPSPPG